MTAIEAHVVDDTHLELSTPINLPPGAKIVAYVVEPDESDGREHEDWLRLSTPSFERCFGPNEPEYTGPYEEIFRPDLIK